MTDKRLKQLAEALDCNTDDINPEDWLILNDMEADKACEEYILESLWAFNADFIACHSKADFNPAAIEALRKMQGELCEDANPLVEAMIADIDEFIQDAIRIDGRGHFLSPYDGEEVELEDDTFAYRIN